MAHWRFVNFVWLATLLLLVSCASSPGPVTESPGTPSDPAGEGDPPVALQMHTLRTYGSLQSQLALAARAGYGAIEAIDTHDRDAPSMNALAKAHGLDIVSVHVDLTALREDLSGRADFAARVGSEGLVLSWLAPEERPVDAEGWRALGRELDAVGERLRERGLGLAYHSHAFEMVEFEGRPALDHLLNAADPANLSWQADVAWIALGGQDPAAMLVRHAGRISSIHAKDVARSGEGGPEGGFADVGHGELDWDAILSAAQDAEVDWYIVEHDEPSDHERSIRRSYTFLAERLEGLRRQDR